MKTIHIETKNKGLIKKLWPLLEKDGKFHFFYEPELVIRISKKKVLRAVKNYLEKNSFEYREYAYPGKGKKEGGYWGRD